MYKDRLEAGERLAVELEQHKFEEVSVFAVPRGGVIVAVPIAKLFNTGLDVLVTRKIGHPANQEFAIGAVMPDGSPVLDSEVIRSYRVPRDYIDKTIAEEYAELRRRILMYTGKETIADVEGKSVIVVDDGIATGYTIRAAVRWLKTKNPLKIVVAVPVAPPDVVRDLEKEVDLVVCPLQPDVFWSVGGFYDNFAQVSDDEVMQILAELNTE